MHRYTLEQVEFIRNNVVGQSYAKLTEIFNAKFGLNLTASQIGGFIGNRKLNTGLTGRFEKGHVPVNKGIKGEHLSPSTEFKKGNRPANYRSVGSERINADGYCEVKIADPRKWKMKHVVVWEQLHGLVPKGHAVIFGDGDQSNMNPDNLVLVSRRQLAVLNRRGLIQNDVELTKSGILVADLLMKCSDLNKRLKQHKKRKGSRE